MCAYSCGVVALKILVKLHALVKSQNFTYVGFKRCGVVALMILVELLALVKSQNFTCVCFKRCGVVALKNPRKMTCSRKKPKFHLCGFQTLWYCVVLCGIVWYFVVLCGIMCHHQTDTFSTYFKFKIKYFLSTYVLTICTIIV